MKKFLISLFMIVSLVMVMGCSNGLSDVGPIEERGAEIGMEELSADMQAAIRTFGPVNKIYSATPKTPAKFYTGQIISAEEHYGIPLYFEAYVVEFDSLKGVISNYISNIAKDSSEQSDSLIHQHYNNIEFDETKKYVEFATYRVYEEEKNVSDLDVYMYETRYFSGDFMKKLVWGNNGDYPDWYAKSITFDPTMTIDIYRNKNIYTNEKATYKYYRKDYVSKSIDPETQLPNYENLSILGKITNVYQNTYSDANGPTNYYLVEYDKNSVSKKVFEYIEKNHNAENVIFEQQYISGNYSNDKFYIEYHEEPWENDNDSGINKWLTSNINGNYYKSCYWQGDFDSIKESIAKENFETVVVNNDNFEGYDNFSKLGTISNILKNTYTENPELNSETYLIEYSVMPNADVIKKFVKKYDNREGDIQKYKNPETNEEYILNKEYNYIECTKNVFENGNFNWQSRINVEGTVYTYYFWEYDFEKLSNGEIIDEQKVLGTINEENSLYSDMSKIGTIKNVYGMRNLPIKDSNGFYRVSFIFEYTDFNRNYSSDEKSLWYEQHIVDNYDKNNTYVEVTIDNYSENIKNYTVLIKHGAPDIYGEDWNVLLKFGTKQDFYKVIGKKIPFTTEKVNNFEGYDNFSKLGTINNILKNNYTENPELNSETYLIEYSEMPNAEVIKEIFKKYDDREGDIQKYKNPGTDEEFILKDTCNYIECTKNVFDNGFNWQSRINVNGIVYTYTIADWNIEKLAKGNKVDIGSILGNEEEEMSLYGKMKKLGNVINVYDSRNLAVSVGKNWRVSFLFEYTNFNKKCSSDKKRWLYEEHIVGNYDKNNTYVEVTIDNNSENIKSYTVLIKQGSDSLYNDDWNVVLDSGTEEDFNNFISIK